MYNGNKGGGWNNGPKRSFGGDRGGDRGDRQMFAATCADCGKSTEVPFKPIAGRPVFCRDCFKKDENGGAPKFGGGMDFGGGRESRDSRGFEEKKMHKAMCDKCGQECEVPFRPTGEKPVYCRPCFGKPGGSDNRFAAADNRHTSPAPRTENYAEQFKAVNAKLEMIMKALGVNVSAPKATPAPVAAKAPTAPVAAKPEAKAKAPKKTAKAKAATKKKK